MRRRTPPARDHTWRRRAEKLGFLNKPHGRRGAGKVRREERRGRWWRKGRGGALTVWSREQLATSGLFGTGPAASPVICARMGKRSRGWFHGPVALLWGVLRGGVVGVGRSAPGACGPSRRARRAAAGL